MEIEEKTPFTSLLEARRITMDGVPAIELRDPREPEKAIRLRAGCTFTLNFEIKESTTEHLDILAKGFVEDTH